MLVNKEELEKLVLKILRTNVGKGYTRIKAQEQVSLEVNKIINELYKEIDYDCR